MDKEYLEKYIPVVSNIFKDKISKMQGIDPSKVNGDILSPIIEKAAKDFLVLKHSMYSDPEFGMMDEFTAENLNVDDNWHIGNLQCKSDDLGLSIDFSRFGAEDLSDFSIQLIGETERGERIAIVESNDGPSGRISNEEGQIVQWREGKLVYAEGSTKIGYEQAPSEDLETIIQMYQDGVFSEELQKAAEAHSAITGNSSIIPITSGTRETEVQLQEKQLSKLIEKEKGKDDTREEQ